MLTGHFVDLHASGYHPAPSELWIDITQGRVKQGVTHTIALGKNEKRGPARITAQLILICGRAEDTSQLIRIGDDIGLRARGRPPPVGDNLLQTLQPPPQLLLHIAESESAQVNQVAGQPREEGLWCKGPWGRCVEKRQKRDFLTNGAELLGHLERDNPAERQSAQEIGPLGLHGPDLCDIPCGQVLHARVVGPGDFGHKPVDGLLLVQVASQRIVDAQALAEE